MFSMHDVHLRMPIIEFKHMIIQPGVEMEALMGCPEGMWTAIDAGGGYVLLTNHFNENKAGWLAPQSRATVEESDRLAVKGGTFTPGGSTNIEDLGGLTTYVSMPAEVEPFKIGRLEVTNAQFAAFLSGLEQRDNISAYYDLNHPAAKIVRYGSQFRALKGCGDYPVTCVTWHGASAFCRSQEGRLPDNVQWELAARGYERNLYPWGNEFSISKCNIYGDRDGYAWLSPAETFAQWAGPFGTLNQAGNAYEWVYNPDNPPADGPVVGCDLRGGAWDTLPFTARSDAVDNNFFTAANQHNGFRCVW